MNEIIWTDKKLGLLMGNNGGADHVHDKKIVNRLIDLAGSEDGFVLPLFGAALVAFMALFALVIDISFALSERNTMQQVADNAVRPAAVAYWLFKSNNASGSAPGIANAQAAATNVARAVAKKNGYADDGCETVCVDVIYSPDIKLGGYQGNDYAVEVDVTKKRRNIFKTIVGDIMPIKVRSVAAYNSAPCMVALGSGSNGRYGVSVNGGSGNSGNVVDLPCGIFSNSTNGKNDISSNLQNLNAAVLATAGCSALPGALCNQPPIVDPYSNVVASVATKYTAPSLPASKGSGKISFPADSSTLGAHSCGSGTCFTYTTASSSSQPDCSDAQTYPTGCAPKLTGTGDFNGPGSFYVNGFLNSDHTKSNGQNMSGSGFNFNTGVWLDNLQEISGVASFADLPTATSSVFITPPNNGTFSITGNVKFANGSLDITRPVRISASQITTIGDYDKCGVAGNYYINGDLAISSETHLGPGNYYINGALRQNSTLKTCSATIWTLSGLNLSSGSRIDAVKSVFLISPSSTTGIAASGNNITTNITAPENGPFAGYAIVDLSNYPQSGGSIRQSGWSGSGNSFAISGVIYSPGNELNLNGSTSTARNTCMTIAAYSVKVNGSLNIQSGCLPTNANLSSFADNALVE